MAKLEVMGVEFAAETFRGAVPHSCELHFFANCVEAFRVIDLLASNVLMHEVGFHASASNGKEPSTPQRHLTNDAMMMRALPSLKSHCTGDIDIYFRICRHVRLCDNHHRLRLHERRRRVSFLCVCPRRRHQMPSPTVRTEQELWVEVTCRRKREAGFVGHVV